MDDDVLLNIPELKTVLKTHEEAKYIYQDSKLFYQFLVVVDLNCSLLVWDKNKVYMYCA